LNVAGWNSLDDQESDPELQGWDEAAGSDANLLSELMLLETDDIEAATSLSLGQAFNVGGAEDLKFFVGLADGTLMRGVIDYVPGGLSGDFNDDNSVDAADFAAWRKNVGTNNSLSNDPIGGTVGPAQYDLWRSNFGKTVGGASSSRAAVPEPSTLLLTAGFVFVLSIRPRSDRL
jgi:hypothetical protein